VIAANSMALTSWIPSGALAKMTQFSVGAIDRTNPGTNLSAAGMTAEVAMNAGNLLSDIKPGYMLGAKPRQQAIGHAIGIFSGALASVPIFFVLFVPQGGSGAITAATLVTDQFPFPAAMQWKGVAELIAKGVSGLPTSAVVAMAVAAVLAALFEGAAVATRGRFPLSAVSIGLGVVLPPEAVVAMFLGALFFHLMGRRHADPASKGHALWAESQDPICAGFVAGAALVGIGNAVLNAFLP